MKVRPIIKRNETVYRICNKFSHINPLLFKKENGKYFIWELKWNQTSGFCECSQKVTKEEVQLKFSDAFMS